MKTLGDVLQEGVQEVRESYRASGEFMKKPANKKPRVKRMKNRSIMKFFFVLYAVLTAVFTLSIVGIPLAVLFGYMTVKAYDELYRGEA